MKTKATIENLRRMILKEYQRPMQKLVREYQKLANERDRRLKALEVVEGNGKKVRKPKRSPGKVAKANQSIEKQAQNTEQKSLIHSIRDFTQAQSGNFSTRDVLDYLKSKGITPAQSTVSTTLVRMFKLYGELDEVERKGRMAIYKRK